MLLSMSERSNERLKTFTSNVFSVLRMIVGAYYLAKAVGLMIVPGRHVLMEGVFSNETALTICATFFAVCGSFLLMAVLVRPIATLLVFHVISTTIGDISMGSGGVAVQLAQSGGLIVGIILVAIGHPSKSWSLMEFVRVRRALNHKLPVMPDLPHMSQQSEEPEIDLVAKRPAILSDKDADEWGDDDAGNLFDELWERKPRSKMSQVA